MPVGQIEKKKIDRIIKTITQIRDAFAPLICAT